jgi:ribosomal protein L24E
MPAPLQKCTFCGKLIFRDSRRMNENEKRGWKVFCSNKCLGLSRRKREEFVCSNPGCGKRFIRNSSDSAKSRYHFCSLSCAAIVNNERYPRDHGKIIKICAYCKIEFFGREKYCSAKCQHLDKVVPAPKLLFLIKEFVKVNGRIPYKWEIGHYSAIRGRFGTWNKAIEAAGFKPNPVMFAKKYIAKDGDKCDSLAEKIIDDYLSKRNIKHVRNFPYPVKDGFTVDFKVGENWIEFFGLSGQLKRYDELMKRKLKLAKSLGINLIKIYPKDLFPKSKLSDKIGNVI